MSFVVAPIDSIRVKVDIITPTEDGGTKHEDCFVRFKKLSMTAFRKMNDKINRITIKEDKEEEEEDKEEGENIWRYLIDVIIDVEGLKDKSGEDIAYSREVGEQLLDMQYVTMAFHEKFLSISAGDKETERRKNLQKSGKRGR